MMQNSKTNTHSSYFELPFIRGRLSKRDLDFLFVNHLELQFSMTGMQFSFEEDWLELLNPIQFDLEVSKVLVFFVQVIRIDLH